MGNCACGGASNNTANNASNQKYKLLIIGPTFSGKTTFLKALQILYSTGFDEMSNEIYKDIMIRQIIYCIRTIVEHITSDDEKMEDEISFHSEITRDHSHLSVDDVSRHALSYSGGSIGIPMRNQHLQRQNSKSVKPSINMKKFENPEIAKAAEFFLNTKFSQSQSYFEWLANKKFIDNLNMLWNDKQIQNVFSQNYFSTTKLPQSTKFFVESILAKLTAIHNGSGNDNNNQYGSTGDGSGNGSNDSNNNNNTNSNNDENDDEKYNSNHRKEHSRTTSFGRSKDGSEITMENYDHPKGIDSMISVPMLASQSQAQSGIVNGNNNNNNNNNSNNNNNNNNGGKGSGDGNDDDNEDNDNNNNIIMGTMDTPNNDKNNDNPKNKISLRYRPSNKEILLCYHRTINRNKEKIQLGNKLAFELWDVGGSKSEMKKWILYCQRTNIVVFCVSLFQVSMLKYTLQLWESIINTKYEQWFGTQRAMNELILMANESSNRGSSMNGGNNNNGQGGQGNGDGNNQSPNGQRGGYSHINGGNNDNNGNGQQSEALNNNNNNGNQNSSVMTGGQNGNGSSATTIDIARIPCILLLNGRERLGDMITKEKLNIKQNRACIQFFHSYSGDTKNVDQVVDFVRDTFMKSLKKKESRIQVTPLVCDCINVDSVKSVFEDIQEICHSSFARGR